MTDDESNNHGERKRVAKQLERQATIAAVREGLDSIKRGEGRPPQEVFAEIEKELLAKARG